MNATKMKIFLLTIYIFISIEGSPINQEAPRRLNNVPFNKGIDGELLLYLDNDETPQKSRDDSCIDCYTTESKNIKKVLEQSAIDKRHKIHHGSWGLAGYPFNVLYKPTSRTQKQEKLFRFIQPSDGEVEDYKEYQEEITPHKEEPEKKLFQDANGVIYIKNRRRYSIIPQLFVSYGWGPLGK